MSAVPPNHGVDRDWPVLHRGTGAHDEQFSEASNTVEAGMLVGTMIAIERALTSRCQLSSRERIVGVSFRSARPSRISRDLA
jgi:hypothetical protein